MALFDLIQSAMGRPDPSMAIAHALGQGPGQPGSPQGPQPLAGAAPPGPPAGQGGAPGASGAPPGPPAAPQPQATQTPPDLGQMFVQLMQRQQASEGFNRGLGMLAAGFAQPRDRAAMIDAMSGQSGDPGSTMGNLMKLQQWNIQQQRMGEMQKNLPAIAEAMGLPLAAVQTMYASNPETFGSEIARIQEAQMGLTGDPVQRELSQTRREWHQQNPGKTDADMIAAKPELAGPVEFQAGRTRTINDQADAGKDKLTAVSSFHVIDPTLASTESNVEWLADPAHKDAVIKAINTPEAFTTDTLGNLVAASGATGVDNDVLQARSKLNWLKKQLYADRFVGTKNLRSNTEANNLGASVTNLDTRTNDAQAITDELARLKTQTYTARANLAASAGKVVPAKYSGLADPAYLNPKSLLYNGAKEEAPDEGGGSSAGGGSETPPAPNAKKAADGKWYVPDPARPGKYLRVD